jgi:hypothetical protein
MYLNFYQHLTMSEEDEKLNGSLINYAKDSSTSWCFRDTADAQGFGLCNNVNMVNLGVGVPVDMAGEIKNDGMYKRQINAFNHFTNGKQLVLSADTGAGDVRPAASESLYNYIVSNTACKIYYYDCVIRLRDLAPSFFGSMPMSRGQNLRITLTLNNNITFKFRKSNGGVLDVEPTTWGFSNVSSEVNPLMISASYLQASATFRFNSGNAANGVASANNTFYPSGSSSLPIPAAGNNTYTVACRLGTNNTVTGVAAEHPRRNCRLYVPAYTFSLQYESLYTQNPQRIFNYLDLEYYSFTAKVGSYFNVNLTNGISRGKTLVMIGVLTTAHNKDIPTMSSPFTTEPSTTSPFRISQFQTLIGGVNVYPSAISYGYEHFITEMNNNGLNANLVSGMTSSRISYVDYINNYHYIVVDLSRRSPEDEFTSQSIQVQGQISSLKDVVFHCFITKQKTMAIDVMTGARLQLDASQSAIV